MSGISVGVRVRPFNDRERRFDSKNVIVMDTLEEPGVVKVLSVRKGVVCLDEKPKEFQFDASIWSHNRDDERSPFQDQADVFATFGVPVVQHALEGFNSTLFAYGQTGSGKTYSMIGFAGEEGVIPRVGAYLFAALPAVCATGSSLGAEASVSVSASYMEIYNEQVFDLLSSSPALKVRQHPSRGVFVEGLKSIALESEECISQVIAEGDRRRKTSSTNMNAVSSRSHAVLMLTVTYSENSEVCRTSKLSLIDLAGSERASSTGAEGDVLAEGASINRSLTVLGMCLDRLAEQAASGPSSKLPIPFRDSQLTFLLCESLGGNTKTFMLANISPADVNVDETLSTLRFAQIAKKVKSRATVNETPKARIIRELRIELAALKKQLLEVQSKRPLHIPIAIDVKSTSVSESVSDAWSPVEEDVLAVAQVPEGEQQSDEALSKTIQEREEALSKIIIPVEPSSNDNEVADGDSLLADSTQLAAEGNMQTAIEDTPDDEDVTSVLATAESRAQEASRQPHDASLAIFVDWNKPQLVCISDAAEPIVQQLTPGKSYFCCCARGRNLQWSLGTATQTVVPHLLEITYHPIDGCITAIAAHQQNTASRVEIDGVRIEEAMPPVQLKHNSRLSVYETQSGSLMSRFRLSFCSSLISAPKFCTIVGTTEHLDLLERYSRSVIELEMFKTLPSGSGQNPQAEGLGSSSSSASSREVLKTLYCLEETLARDYPPTFAELSRYLRDTSASSPSAKSPLALSTDSAAYGFKDVRVVLSNQKGDENDEDEDRRATGESELKSMVDTLRLAVDVQSLQQQLETDALRVAIQHVTRERRAREHSIIRHKQQMPQRRRLDDADALFSGMKDEKEESPPEEEAAEEEQVLEREDNEATASLAESSVEAIEITASPQTNTDVETLQTKTTKETSVTHAGPSIHLPPVQEEITCHSSGVTEVPTPQLHSSGDEEVAVGLQQCEADAPSSSVLEKETSLLLEEEHQWHQALRHARMARPNGPSISGHQDAAEDVGIWLRFSMDPKSKLPFFKELLDKQLDYYWELKRDAAENESMRRQQEAQGLQSEASAFQSVDLSALSSSSPLGARTTQRLVLSAEEQRAGYVWKLKQGTKAHDWEYRFALLCGRFLYYFYSCDGTCRALAGLYIYGATVQLLDQPLEGKSNVLLLTTTAPRRQKDNATQFYFSFSTEEDRCWWAFWLTSAASPPVPRSLMQRTIREVQQDVNWSVSSAARLSSPSTSMYFYVSPSLWRRASNSPVAIATPTAHFNSSTFADGGSASASTILREKHAHWVPDESSSSCFECKKEFGLFRRRHHCRACGNVVCDACTNTVDMMTNENVVKKKRACTRCVRSSIDRVGRGSLVESIAELENTSISKGTSNTLHVDPNNNSDLHAV